MKNSHALEGLLGQYKTQVPTVPLEDREEFFNSAPVDTLVEIDGDVYRKSGNEIWLHLDELVYAGSNYSEYREYERSASEYMAKTIANSEHTEVSVLKLGLI